MQPSDSELAIVQTLPIPRCDRWQICHRLRELHIPCTCLEDGGFQVTVQSPLAAMQVWSVVYQFRASRPELADWLNRCWQKRSPKGMDT